MRFLRYPGSKSKMLTFLSNYLPNEINGRYIEPFVGGGSVYLSVGPEEAILSDINKELIDLYRGIKNYPHKVWETFKSFPAGKVSYYKVRDKKIENKPLYYKAARTLYLNRTCFKGMWRHNPQGNFNVGYGGEDRRWAITHDNIIELSKRFKKALIINDDFENLLEKVKDGDFIFLDPPYSPGEREMNNAHYNNCNFTFQDQIRLAENIKDISSKFDIKWLMTNSSHKDIQKLYKEFNIIKFPKGTSNVVGVLTNKPKEVIISNYKF